MATSSCKTLRVPNFRWGLLQFNTDFSEDSVAVAVSSDICQVWLNLSWAAFPVWLGLDYCQDLRQMLRDLPRQKNAKLHTDQWTVAEVCQLVTSWVDLCFANQLSLAELSCARKLVTSEIRLSLIKLCRSVTQSLAYLSQVQCLLLNSIGLI